MSQNKALNEFPLSCHACQKEISAEEFPESVAITAEGEAYVWYFCGAKCYEHWKKTAGENK